MKKISGSTFYFKKLFPAVWFGFLGFIIIMSVLSGTASPMSIIAPLIMAAFGYALFKNLVWDLADEVYDIGDELIFRKGGKEQRVNLTDIININYTHMSSPERVVLHVRSEGPIGKELAFNLPMRFNPFKKSPFVRELTERIDRGRST